MIGAYWLNLLIVDWLISLIHFTSGQSPTSDGCFLEFRNQALACAIPIERRTGISSESCRQLCLQFTPNCASLVWNPFREDTCDLFGVVAQRRTTQGAGGYYNRQVRRQPLPPSQFQPNANRPRQAPQPPIHRQVQPRQLYQSPQQINNLFLLQNQLQQTLTQIQRAQTDNLNRYLFHEQYLAHVLAREARNKRAKRQINQSRYPSFQATSPRRAPVLKQYQTRQVYNTNGGYIPDPTCPYPQLAPYNNEGATYYERTQSCNGNVPAPGPGPSPGPGTTPAPNTFTTTTSTTTRPTPQTEDCPIGQVSRFMIYEGYELPGADDVVFNARDVTVCLQRCQDNQLEDGSSFTCISAEYNLLTNDCVFSSAAIITSAIDNQLISNPDAVFLQKTCLDASTFGDCFGPILVKPDSILVGSATTVIPAQSLDECLDFCVNAVNIFGFQCLSGMLFNDGSLDNCILNEATADTKPELFVEEAGEPVVYFEPRCTAVRLVQLTRRLALPDEAESGAVLTALPNWSTWSNCILPSQQQVRYRSCRDVGQPRTCEKHERPCQPDQAPLWPTEHLAEETEEDWNNRSSRDNRYNDESPNYSPCSPILACCPLQKRDGSLDCENGLRVTETRRYRCKPQQWHCLWKRYPQRA